MLVQKEGKPNLIEKGSTFVEQNSSGMVESKNSNAPQLLTSSRKGVRRCIIEKFQILRACKASFTKCLSEQLLT